MFVTAQVLLSKGVDESKILFLRWGPGWLARLGRMNAKILKCKRVARIWCAAAKRMPCPSCCIPCSLIAAPEGIHTLCRQFPRLKIVTSEIDECIDADFRVVPGVGNVSHHAAAL
jgi:hypothetical protein